MLLRLYFLASMLAAATGVGLHAVHPAAETLLAPVPLPGTQTTVRWNELSSLNSSGTPSSGSGTIQVNSPGFRGSAGYYSFSGPYSLTATITALPVGAPQTVVLQIIGMLVSDPNVDLDFSVEEHLGFEGGPVLTYTHAGGSATLTPLASGTRGTPISGAGGGFEGDYHAFTWQWDLRNIDPALNITGLEITAPLVAHSSTVGVQIDAGDAYALIFDAPALTALAQWRVLHFESPKSTGIAADDADADGDGLPNLLEYALGRHPWLHDSGPDQGLSLGIVSDAVGPRLALTFDRIADPSLRYIVEAKNDLAAPTWTEIETRTGPDNTAGPVTVEDTQLLSASPRRFLRLRIETTTP